MRQPDWTSDDGRVVLYCGDCLEILPTIESGVGDIIWTDPPYGHSNHDGDFNARLNDHRGIEQRPIANDDAESMREVVSFMLKEASRILKRDCCCCCCCCCGGGGPKPTFAWLAERMDRDGLSFFHSVIWDKINPGLGWRYRRQHEMVMVAHRRGGKLLWANDTKAIANVIRVSPDRDREHPNQKPTWLVEQMLSAHAHSGLLCIDPFMGGGTTGVAAVRLGLRFIGIEIDRAYFDTARDRIQREIVSVRNSLPLTFEQPPQQTDLLEAHE